MNTLTFSPNDFEIILTKVREINPKIGRYINSIQDYNTLNFRVVVNNGSVVMKLRHLTGKDSLGGYDINWIAQSFKQETGQS